MQREVQLEFWTPACGADADLTANEAEIREVLIQAQGESALEEFLRQVKDAWREREFVMVPCGNKCKVIKGWEDLFQIIDDQLASLQSMKMSPFFKVKHVPLSSYRFRLFGFQWESLSFQWKSL